MRNWQTLEIDVLPERSGLTRVRLRSPDTIRASGTLEVAGMASVHPDMPGCSFQAPF